MDAYLNNLRELLALICRQTWATPGFWVVVAVSLVTFFFGAGTMARVIFGKDTGLLKTFLAKLTVFTLGVAAAGLWLTWGGGTLIPALLIGAGVAVAAMWFSGYVLGIPYWPAFGIGVFALVLLVGVAQGAGYACKAVADSASQIESQSTGRFQQAK